MKRRAYMMWLDEGPVHPSNVTDWFDEEPLRANIGHWIRLARSIYFTSDLDLVELAGLVEHKWSKLKQTLYVLIRLDDKLALQGRLPMAVWNLIAFPEEASESDKRFWLLSLEDPAIEAEANR